jgi:hypothetical protein
MRIIESNGSRLAVLPVIKGLVSEGDKVNEAVTEFGPKAIGLSLSKEELGALKGGQSYDDYELTLPELAYKSGLEMFGPVQLPFPCYARAIEISQDEKIPLLPIDMNEEQFTDQYCQLVGGMEMVLGGMTDRRLYKKQFDLSTPEAFVRDYDRKVNNGEGYRKLMRLREEHMARMLIGLRRRYSDVLAIIELERSDGVIGILDQ